MYNIKILVCGREETSLVLTWDVPVYKCIVVHIKTTQMQWELEDTADSENIV